MHQHLLKHSLSHIQFVSDLHLEKGFKRIIHPLKPFLILAGDIGYPTQQSYKKFLLEISYYFDKVFVLSGNHEYDNIYSSKIPDIDTRIENICIMRNNLYFLQKKSYLLCPKLNITLTGCTMWSRLPETKHIYHLDHVKWLTETLVKNQNTNHIVATHHCPLFENLYIKYHSNTSKYFATDQSNLVKKTNVLAWIHGHNHLNRNINLYGKWIMSNQYGSYENPLRGYR